MGHTQKLRGRGQAGAWQFTDARAGWAGGGGGGGAGARAPPGAAAALPPSQAPLYLELRIAQTGGGRSSCRP
jgi:hypothetical protein